MRNEMELFAPVAWCFEVWHMYSARSQQEKAQRPASRRSEQGDPYGHMVMRHKWAANKQKVQGVANSSGSMLRKIT